MSLVQDTAGGGARTPVTELPALTSLRGIAALTVVFYHSSFLAFHFAAGGPPRFWLRGYLAVDLFFLLSGFVLTHVYGKRFARSFSWRAVGTFLWARFCRVYPASLFAILVYVLAHAFGRLAIPAHASFNTQLIAGLTLMQVPWLDTVLLNGPSWSISAEWYAYLLFPFFVPLILGLRRRTAIALAIFVFACIAADHAIVAPDRQTAGWFALLRVLPEFSGGIIAYRAYDAGLWRKFLRKDSALLSVTAAIATTFWLDLPDVLIVFLFPVLLLAAVSNRERVIRILDMKPLRKLGDISYSLYIFQTVPFMAVVAFSQALAAHGVSGVRFEALAALSALAGGILVHRRVDLPVRAILRRLPAWMESRRTAVQRDANGSRVASRPQCFHSPSLQESAGIGSRFGS